MLPCKQATGSVRLNCGGRGVVKTALVWAILTGGLWFCPAAGAAAVKAAGLYTGIEYGQIGRAHV